MVDASLKRDRKKILMCSLTERKVSHPFNRLLMNTLWRENHSVFNKHYFFWFPSQTAFPFIYLVDHSLLKGFNLQRKRELICHSKTCYLRGQNIYYLVSFLYFNLTLHFNLSLPESIIINTFFYILKKSIELQISTFKMHKV